MTYKLYLNKTVIILLRFLKLTCFKLKDIPLPKKKKYFQQKVHIINGLLQKECALAIAGKVKFCNSIKDNVLKGFFFFFVFIQTRLISQCQPQKSPKQQQILRRKNVKAFQLFWQLAQSCSHALILNKAPEFDALKPLTIKYIRLSYEI